MALIDAQGRLFGRLNVVDTAVVLVIGLLIPLAYGAYVLFRPPAARLLAVDPARVTVGTTQVTIKGEHLRPTFRMTIGTMGTTFLFANPGSGVLQVPPLRIGSYDVVLFDEELEIDRLRGALVVEESVAADAVLLAVGGFPALDTRQVQMLSRDLQASLGHPAPWGEVRGFLPAEPSTRLLGPVATPVSVPDGRYHIKAVLKLPCVLGDKECRFNQIPLVVGAAVPVQVTSETLKFEIEELHPEYDGVVELVLRTHLLPDELALLRTWKPGGDSSFPARDALLPTLVSLSVVFATQDQQRATDVRLRVPALETPAGWVYGGRVLRVGDYFYSARGLQLISGRIIAVAPQARAQENGGQ